MYFPFISKEKSLGNNPAIGEVIDRQQTAAMAFKPKALDINHGLPDPWKKSRRHFPAVPAAVGWAITPRERKGSDSWRG
jgi:hypothetical protein